jgi:hypothetical protein
MSKAKKRYDYRGQIERGADYQWTEGYSETTETGGVIYPWGTRAECKAAAKREGSKAEFFRNGEREA